MPSTSGPGADFANLHFISMPIQPHLELLNGLTSRLANPIGGGGKWEWDL